MVTLDGDAAPALQEATKEANASGSNAANAPSAPMRGLTMANRPSDANLASSSSGNAAAAAGECTHWSSDGSPCIRCSCIDTSYPGC